MVGYVILVLVFIKFINLVFKLVEVCHESPHTTLKVRHFSIK